MQSRDSRRVAWAFGTCATAKYRTAMKSTSASGSPASFDYCSCPAMSVDRKIRIPWARVLLPVQDKDHSATHTTLAGDGRAQRRRSLLQVIWYKFPLLAGAASLRRARQLFHREASPSHSAGRGYGSPGYNASACRSAFARSHRPQPPQRHSWRVYENAPTEGPAAFGTERRQALRAAVGGRQSSRYMTTCARCSNRSRSSCPPS